MAASAIPGFITAMTAENIASETRPTHVSPECLGALNTFLDELLGRILAAARSFDIARLKKTVLRVLPSALGQDVVAEAELELRSYFQDNGIPLPSSIPAPPLVNFPFEPALLLLRHKILVYSTMSERRPEDRSLTVQLGSNLRHAAGEQVTALGAIGPAAIYCAAIIERIAERICTNIGQVVSRDSANHDARLSDLYAALVEDELIYALFSGMSCKSVIEGVIKTQQARRQRTYSKSAPSGPAAASLSSDPSPPLPVVPSRTSSSVSRQSADFLFRRDSARGIEQQPRKSSSSSGVFRRFGRRSSDKDSGGAHKGAQETATERSSQSLSESLDSESKRSFYAAQLLEEEESRRSSSFDERLRDPTTVKISLTPSRLKTFEVVEKGRAGGLPRLTVPKSLKFAADLQSSKSIPSPFPPPPSSFRPPRTSSQRFVARGATVPRTPEEDELEEDEDDEILGPVRPVRRKESLIDFLNSAPPWEKADAAPAPTPSSSSSGNPRLRTQSAAARTSSSLPPPPSTSTPSFRSGSSVPPSSSFGSASTASTGMPVRKSHKKVDSLDEILNAPEGDEEAPSDDESTATGPTTKKRDAGAGGGDGMSELSRDLVDFFNNAPPPPSAPGPAPLSRDSSSDSFKGGSGSGLRFKNLFTRKKDVKDEEGTVGSSGGSLRSQRSSPSLPTEFGGHGGSRSGSATGSLSGATSLSKKVVLLGDNPLGPSSSGGRSPSIGSRSGLSSPPVSPPVPPLPPVNTAISDQYAAASMKRRSSANAILNAANSPSTALSPSHSPVPSLNGRTTSIDEEGRVSLLRHSPSLSSSRGVRGAMSPRKPVPTLCPPPPPVEHKGTSTTPIAEIETGTQTPEPKEQPLAVVAPAAPQEPSVPISVLVNLHSLLSVAETADECRLLVSAFLRGLKVPIPPLTPPASEPDVKAAADKPEPEQPTTSTAVETPIPAGSDKPVSEIEATRVERTEPAAAAAAQAQEAAAESSYVAKWLLGSARDSIDVERKDAVVPMPAAAAQKEVYPVEELAAEAATDAGSSHYSMADEDSALDPHA